MQVTEIVLQQLIEGKIQNTIPDDFMLQLKKEKHLVYLRCLFGTFSSPRLKFDVAICDNKDKALRVGLNSRSQTETRLNQ